MVPHYELFLLPPSSLTIDPADQPLPLWLKLGLGAAVSFFVVLGVVLG